MLEKIEYLWDHLSSYIIYFTAATISFMVESTSGIDDTLQLVNVVTDTVINHKGSLFVVTDGHLIVFGLLLTELLQLIILMVTVMLTLAKGYYDICNHIYPERRQIIYKRWTVERRKEDD